MSRNRIIVFVLLVVVLTAGIFLVLRNRKAVDKIAEPVNAEASVTS